MRRRVVLCKLLRLPYGFIEASRQYLCAMWYWITHSYGIDHVMGIDQLFQKGESNGGIHLIAAKVFDNFLVDGNSLQSETSPKT